MPSAETGTGAPLAERYRVLLDIGRTLTGTLSPEDLYRSIYRETARVVEAGGFYISLYDAQADLATVVFYADRGEESRCDITYKGSDSEVIRTGKSTVVEDRLKADSVMLLGDDETEITRSAISVPLMYKGVVRGALSTQSYRPNGYDAEDLELLEGIADLAAVAIEDARHVTELAQRSREAEKLEEIGRALTSSLDFEEVMARVSAAAMDLLDADGAGVWTFENTVATVRNSVGEIQVPVGATWDMEGPVYDTLVSEGKALVINDLAASPLVPDHMREFLEGGSGMAIPLVIGERVAGALAAGSRAIRGFSEYDTGLLTRLAGQASVALDNAELHANIQALSLTDVLTGLPNRRHLQLHLEREVTPRVPGGSAVEPRGQEPALDADRLERANLLRLGGQPRQAGVLEHVIEREQAPQEHFIGSGPAVADVLGAERAVDPAPADPADFPAFQCLVGCQPSLRHGPDEPKSLPAIDP